MATVPGIHLYRTAENIGETDALADRHGGRVGIGAVLDSLDRQGRRACAVGRKVSHSFTWDAEDRRSRSWWPQGISASADADASELVCGRAVLAVTSYSVAGQGSRVTFVDPATLRYRHVLLVVPDADGGWQPLRIHAGGLAWVGPYLHVAGTGRGLFSCRLEDVVATTAGFVLPVRFRLQAVTDDGFPALRYSFLSVDRSVAEVVAGEYGRRRQTTRLVRFPVDLETGWLGADADGLSRPLGLDDAGVRGMQGAVTVRGTSYLTVSRGPLGLGWVYVGRPGAWRRHRWATPIGPEDLTYWPSTDTLWSVTEHPWRRWVFAMARTSLG